MPVEYDKTALAEVRKALFTTRAISFAAIGLAVVLPALAYFYLSQETPTQHRPTGLIPGAADAGPLTIYIFTSDDNICYVAPALADMYTFPGPAVPYQVIWTNIGKPHSYNLTLSAPLKNPVGNPVTTIPIATGGSSAQYDASIVTPKPSGAAITYTNITQDGSATSCMTSAPIGIRVTH